jgi:hypothetical protein
MAQEKQLMTREAFMEALETDWGRYLPTLDSLTDEDRARYAQHQGYANLKDVVAHITAWMQKTIEVVSSLQRGERFERDWANEAEFNARAVEQARNQTYEQVAQDFENARTGLAGLIAELPVDAVSNPLIYDWLYETIITHYREHEPPGDPQIPAEQHVLTNDQD